MYIQIRCKNKNQIGKKVLNKVRDFTKRSKIGCFQRAGYRKKLSTI